MEPEPWPHSDVLTTFTSYGSVPLHRQSELIRARAVGQAEAEIHDANLLVALEAIKARLGQPRSEGPRPV